MSEEETGRKVRYELFSEVANAEGCTKIAVAHHKNDLAETVIFNMVRGSGLSGLAGISSVRENIIRPLLCVGRQDIETYLDELGQGYKTDSTNNALDYTRNKIRNTLIPVLEELNSEAVEHIVSLAMDAENADRFVEAQAEKIFNRAKLKNCMNKVSPDKNNVSIYLDITMLRQTDSVVLYKLIHNALIKLAEKKKDITRRHIESVVSLIFTDTGKSVMLPYNMSARRSYDILIIERTENIKTDGKNEKNIAFDSLAGGIVAVDLECVPDALSPNGAICPKLEFLRTERPQGDKNFMEKNVYTKIFSYDKILAKNLSGLCIRTKREGDYIVITPDGGTKKLNRVFIDSKVDRKAREIWPLIALGDEILWAVGLRYNEDYRVTEDTKTILKVTYITQV
jgi:tRNA(Ile)-lysidine synthase